MGKMISVNISDDQFVDINSDIIMVVGEIIQLRDCYMYFIHLDTTRCNIGKLNITRSFNNKDDKSIQAALEDITSSRRFTIRQIDSKE